MRALRAVLLLACAALPSCTFVKLKREVKRIDRTAYVTGTLAGELTESTPLYVVHLVAEKRRAVHRLIPSLPEYGLLVKLAEVNDVAAFADLDGDAVYDPGEPCAFIGGLENLEPMSQSAVELPPLVLRKDARLPVAVDLRFARPAQGTTLGEVVSLDEPRYSEDRVSEGMWSPLKATARVDYGLQFVGPHQPGRTPVLFIHGIKDSPRAFAKLIASLDTTRFEPWVVYYPSGLRVPVLAQVLAGQLVRAKETFKVERLYIVAHSMGGLVARGTLLELEQKGELGLIAGLVTLSTPFGGHPSAKFALDYAPSAVPSWIDLAPGSKFLQQLDATPVNKRVPHHLFFTFGGRRDRWEENNDGVVSLPSQLTPSAQAGATSLHGFNLSHAEVLTSPDVASTLWSLLR